MPSDPFATAEPASREIRSVGSGDLRQLLALYEHLHARDDPLPADAVVQAVWDEQLSHPGFHCFGGYEAGTLVSSCTLVIVPNLSRGCRPYGLIENVVTHSAYRNRGWGKALLAHALAFAWSARCYKVMLMTGRKDEQTLRFYEAAGFDRHGKQAFIARPAS